MLVSLPLIPSRISCWNCARSTSEPVNSPGAAGVGAGSGEGDRLEAVEVVLALLEVELEGAAGDLGADIGRQVDVDAADRVDEAAKAVEVDDRDLVDVEPEQPLDRAHGELRAPGGVGGVDLLRALPGDLGERVARDRELAEGAAPCADQHDRVGAVGRVLAVGPVGSPAEHILEAVFGLGLVRPGEGAGADVGAEHEDRLRRDEHERVAVEGVGDAVGQLGLLDLGREREGDVAEQDPPERRDPRPLEGPAPPRPLVGRAHRLRLPLAVCASAAQPVGQPGEIGLADDVAEAPSRLVDGVLGLVGPLRPPALVRRPPALVLGAPAFVCWRHVSYQYPMSRRDSSLRPPP